MPTPVESLATLVVICLWGSPVSSPLEHSDPRQEPTRAQQPVERMGSSHLELEAMERVASDERSLRLAADSLTLEDALALARANRGQMVVAATMPGAARAEYSAAGAVPNPTALYEYTGDAPREHAIIEQPLDWLLRRSGERAAAFEGVSGALADSTRLVAQVERETRTAFFSALGTARQLALAIEQAAFTDSLAAVAAHRRAAGEISELEENQARLERARAYQVVSLSREEHANAMIELGRALVMEPDAIPPLAGALDRELSEPLPPSPPIDDLPVVARAQADSAAAAARYHATKASRVPLPSLHGGVEWNNPSSDQGATVLIGLSLPLPLWQTGGARTAAAQARAEEDAARLREVRAAAAGALEQTRTRIRETARRALIARDSVLPLAVRQRELVLTTYRLGETDLVFVLDALRAERDVARALVVDLLAYQAARADWLELIGGTGR